MFKLELKETLCRTCLERCTSNKGFNIFTTLDLAKKLMLCSALPVETSDEYPENVCLKCYEQILIFYEFQQMCCKSLDTFNELINTTEEQAKQDVKNLHLEEHELNDPLKEDLNLVNNVEGKIDKVVERKDNNACEKKKRDRHSKNQLENRNTRKPGRRSVSKADSCDVKDGRILSVTDNSQLHQDKNYSQDDCNDQILNESITTETNQANNSNHREETKDKILIDTESCSSLEQLSSSQCLKYQCDLCSESFSILHRLEAHKRQHDGLPPYSCNFKGCQRSFNRFNLLHNHQREHKLEQPTNYKCDVDNCQRTYKNKSALNVHKRKFHHYGPELKSHMCEVCGKVFKSSAVLNDHRYTHIEKTQLPYACEEEGCSKRFSNKVKLKVHKMRHAGIKNFICPHCGMRKTTRNELKIHINYHTLERTWPCRFCSKVCNSAGNLKMHVKTIHERAKDFACRFCERTFAKADTKKYHEMTHTGEKPNQCKDCGKRFLQPAALRTHRKIHLKQKDNLGKKNKCDAVSEIDEVENIIEEVEEESFIMETFVAEILSDGNLE